VTWNSRRKENNETPPLLDAISSSTDCCDESVLFRISPGDITKYKDLTRIQTHGQYFIYTENTILVFDKAE